MAVHTAAPHRRHPAKPESCGNTYNLRHRNEAILDIARAMQLELDDLPEFLPRHRIGISNSGFRSAGWITV
jgi:hypothetical protein